ncbi:unnamed protein product [Caenorhabditis angaria]|uniref:DUF19 domain-containing protein n=1 Tax=Caenorhabditis angaria TaxID=860376 RepID=A0A9P1IP19_9PELO|nr:unnamed protein product [Caenorhabditis angaria]
MLLDSMLQCYIKIEPEYFDEVKVSELLKAFENILVDFGDQIQFLRTKSEVLARFEDNSEIIDTVSLLCSLSDLPENWLLFLGLKNKNRDFELCIYIKSMLCYESQLQNAHAMTRSNLAVLLLLAASASAVQLPEYTLSDEVIQLAGFRERPTNLAVSQCLDIQFNYCQHTFNQFFGLPEDATWRNGTLIFKTVQQFLQTNVTEVVKVCNTRTQYYQCLGTSYSSCLNLYNLLNKPNADFQQTFDFVRTFRGLEWQCVGGFQEVAGQWDCLGTFPTTSAYQNCITTFNNTITANNFCPAVDAAGQCMNNAYNAACGVGAGYFGCENFRITFDNSCWGLRCVPLNQ